MRYAILLLLNLLLIGCNADDTSKKAQSSVRTLEIPMREHGYSNFETTSITTAAEYADFLAQVELQEHWNDKEGFLHVMTPEAINFEKENLIIYRVTEGSGSIALSVQSIEVQTSTLHVSIKRDVPDMGTADMAYYAFAYAADKNVTEALFNVGDKSETVPLSDGVVCTMEYAPVCGAIEVACVAAPCYPVLETFSNDCMLNASAGAFKLYEGECLDATCKQWNDGCNTCGFDEQSGSIYCTEMACETYATPYCLD